MIRKKRPQSKYSSARTSSKSPKKRTGRSTANKQSTKRKPAAPSKKPSPRPKEIKEVSAGGVVFKRSGRKVLFAIMKDSYEKWTFPKGRVEKGEHIEEAAARETLEELGLHEIRLLESLGKIDIWFRDHYEKKGALVHKDIHYYLFETPEDAEFVIDVDQHVHDAKWVSLSQVLKTSSYKDMQPILKNAISFVKKL